MTSECNSVSRTTLTERRILIRCLANIWVHSDTIIDCMLRLVDGSRRPTRRPISFNSKIGASPCYAGSKFSDSPTARVIPLPPTEWIDEAYSSQSDTSSMSSGSFVGTNSDVETSSICSSAPSLSDVGEAFLRTKWPGHILLHHT
ncbi:hypothetical protein ANCCAN_19936 [Ancylostoma caninum]|uniref:Uncharacterized protein n=1 Tax=Ancylostoma caninum TaxID=29170 RepID=A0A368FQ00_ANCCA|nr:hypothetical protein ANCCAN_19936 [Ancylostoma caninum]